MSIFKPADDSLPKPHSTYGTFYIEEDLRHAAYSGDLGRIQQLQRQYSELNINAADEYGQSPLYLACKRNHKNVVDHLLKQPKVDISAPTILGNSPLLIAAWNDNNAIAEALISKGANVHAKTLENREHHGGVTALDIAKERNNPALADLLTNGAMNMPTLD